MAPPSSSVSNSTTNAANLSSPTTSGTAYFTQLSGKFTCECEKLRHRASPHTSRRSPSKRVQRCPRLMSPLGAPLLALLSRCRQQVLWRYRKPSRRITRLPTRWTPAVENVLDLHQRGKFPPRQIVAAVSLNSANELSSKAIQQALRARRLLSKNIHSLRTKIQEVRYFCR